MAACAEHAVLAFPSQEIRFQAQAIAESADGGRPPTGREILLVAPFACRAEALAKAGENGASGSAFSRKRLRRRSGIRRGPPFRPLFVAATAKGADPCVRTALFVPPSGDGGSGWPGAAPGARRPPVECGGGGVGWREKIRFLTRLRRGSGAACESGYGLGVPSRDTSGTDVLHPGDRNRACVGSGPTGRKRPPRVAPTGRGTRRGRRRPSPPGAARPRSPGGRGS